MDAHITYSFKSNYIPFFSFVLKSHSMQEETIKIFFKDRVEETMTSLSYQWKKAPH